MTKKLAITPEENAKELRRQVLIKRRSDYLERFVEFIEDCDDKIDKAMGAIDDNNFAKDVVFESDKADDPRAKDVIASFETAVEMTTAQVTKTRAKREAAVKLQGLVDRNEKVLAIELMSIYDVMYGK